MMTKLDKKVIQSNPSANESVSEVSPEEGINKKGSKCPRFDECSAPLCPFDEDSLINGVWYPGEMICKLDAFKNLAWIIKQRKSSSPMVRPKV